MRLLRDARYELRVCRINSDLVTKFFNFYAVIGFGLSLIGGETRAAENVMLTEVPDYAWFAGCFGTAGGNMIGYWDRHGFPDFYTGPTSNGVAPLNSIGTNEGIRSLWASKAGLDGRPKTQPGHVDDYWNFYFDDFSYSYESAAPDPYKIAGRPEHPADCIGDFIGASQNKWKNVNGEHDGNIDAYAFVIWDLAGGKRLNYTPEPDGDQPVLDIPSGLKAFTRYRGYDADVFSQLVDFNPNVPAGKGFTFENLKAEIDAGYPVMLFLQHAVEKSRELPGMPRANPNVHGMLAFGYFISDTGTKFVRYKTSWGSSGDHTMKEWNGAEWEARLPVRGVIGYRPRPQIKAFTRTEEGLKIRWNGPASTLRNLITGQSTPLHRFVIERSTGVQATEFTRVTEPTTGFEATVPLPAGESTFYRVRLLGSAEQ